MKNESSVNRFKTEIAGLKHREEERLATLRIAVEFGYKQAEKGVNLQAALAEFDRTMASDADQLRRLERETRGARGVA